MKNPVKKVQDYVKREAVRREIMGQAGKGKQDHRKSTLTGSGKERKHKVAVEATRRVGEYKKARASKAAGNTAYINRRSQENLK